LFEKIRELKRTRWGRIALGAALSASLLLPGIMLVRSEGDAPPEPAKARPSVPDRKPIASLPLDEADTLRIPNGAAEPFAVPGEDGRPELSALPVEAPSAVDAPAATVLFDIETSTSPNGGRSFVQLRADGSISNAEVIALANPDRLVIDLPGMTSVMESSRAKGDSARVAGVRVGIHNGMVRVVLDGSSGAEGFESRLVEATDDGLHVTLASRAEVLEPTPRAVVKAPALTVEPVAATAPLPMPTQPVASIAPPEATESAPEELVLEERKLPLYLLADEAKPRLGSGEALEDSYDCIIEPFELVEVGSALTAVVASVDVERSDFVAAGQVLAQLEASPERATVAVANARAKMDGDLLARRARMELGGRKQQRAEQLFESEALSADLRDEIQTEAEVAKAVVQEAREHKQLMKLEYHEAFERLREHTIHSPVSGVVVDRLKSPGEVVKEETIVVVAQIDPLRVEVILPAAVFGTVANGMRAEVIPELPDSGVRVASVTVVDRVVDGTSGTFGVRLELPNSNYAVPSGLRCQVHFLQVD
jgi:RND family efflux transporter MFP subunit